MSMMTEKECAHRISMALADMEERLREAKELRRNAEYRAAVAEWAIAGLLARNLHVSTTYDPIEAQEVKDARVAAEYIGRAAGHQFLRGAELAFDKHAELSDLRTRIDHRHIRHFATEDHHANKSVAPVDDPMMWPRPFK